MSDKVSWIKRVGMDIVKGFAWLASDKGRAVIAAGESVAEIVFPPSAPIIAIVNAWINKAAEIEGKAAAAASLGANVTSAQKATAAIAAVAADVEGILKQYNLLPLSSDALAKINDAVLTIANELEPAPVAPAATPA